MTQARSRTGEAMASNPLVGTWRLVSWENRSAVDGRVSYPLGRDAVGYIMYGDDGHMSVAIMRPDRAKFATEDLLGGEAQERAQAAGTYVSYCGRHEFRGHGHPPRGTQPIPKLGRRCARTPRRSQGQQVDLEHATDIARGRATDRPPDMGGRRNVRAVDRVADRRAGGCPGSPIALVHRSAWKGRSANFALRGSRKLVPGFSARG
jgi:hypothetical protein